MGLFKPAWMADSYAKHEKAIAAVKKITDPEKLFEIAMTAPLTVVRQAAIEGISDQQLLARILRENDNCEVTQSALDRVSDQALLKDAALNGGVGTTYKVVEKIEDSAALVEIAIKSPDDTIQGKAIEQLKEREDIDALLDLIGRCPAQRERVFAFDAINEILSSKHFWDKEYQLPRVQSAKLVDAIVADRDGASRPDSHLAISLYGNMTEGDYRRMAENAASPAVRVNAWKNLLAPKYTANDQLLPVYLEAVENGWDEVQTKVLSRLREFGSVDAAALMDFIRGTDNITIREICAVRLVQDDMDGVEGIEAMRDEAVEAYMAAFGNVKDERSGAAFLCQFVNGLTPAAREKYGFTVSAKEVSAEDGYGSYTYGQTTVTYKGRTYRN